jgi:DNA-binding MarR family transcriptional regulator
MNERTLANPASIKPPGEMTEHPIEAISSLDSVLRRLMWIERVWLKEALREYDLEVAPFMVLTHLKHLGGNTTMGALAKHLDLRNTTMTGHIDRLEGKSLVTRKFGIAEDRRQVTVHLTPKGKAVVERINSSRREHIRQTCAHMAAHELQQFVGLLEAYLELAENEK